MQRYLHNSLLSLTQEGLKNHFPAFHGVGHRWHTYIPALRTSRQKYNYRSITNGITLTIWDRLRAGHVWVTRASGEEQSDPAGRSLVKRRRLAASRLDFALAATLRALVLQRKPARRLFEFIKLIPKKIFHQILPLPFTVDVVIAFIPLSSTRSTSRSRHFNAQNSPPSWESHHSFSHFKLKFLHLVLILI